MLLLLQLFAAVALLGASVRVENTASAVGFIVAGGLMALAAGIRIGQARR